MNGVLGRLSGVALCFWGSLASAQVLDGKPAVAAAPRGVNAAQQSADTQLEEPYWYGWQMLAVDGPAVGLWLSSMLILSADDTTDYESREGTAQPLAIVGTVAFATGGPIVHLSHRRSWWALASLSLRAGLPVLGGVVGYGLTTCPAPGEHDYGNCGMGEALLGAAGGALLAITIDSSVLAWEPAKAAATPGAQLGISPVVSSDGRRELRLFGTF